MLSFSYTQIRIARPTDQLEKVVDFYKNGLGLTEIRSFSDHEGFSGVMPGKVEPENPYWKNHGITIEDPDKWRIVLMEINSFKANE